MPPRPTPPSAITRKRIDEQPPEIAQAEEAIQKNDFAGAETLLKKALGERSQTSSIRHGSIWDSRSIGLNRADESIAAYRKSVAAKPEVFESNLNLGLMLVRANNPEAEQFLRAATTLKPTAHIEEGQARAWLALAHAAGREKARRGIPGLPQGLRADAQRISSLIFPQACCTSGGKNSPTPRPNISKLLALDPHSTSPQSTEAAIGLTNIYMKSGRLGDAEPLLRRLAAERPEDAGIHLQLGRVLAAQDKKDDAIAEMQTALKLAPADSDAQRELADLYASAGKNDLAEAAYRPLVAAHPNDAEFHRGLGQALLRQKKFPEAQQELLVAVRLKRDWPEVYVDLAFAASENKNYDLTIQGAQWAHPAQCGNAGRLFFSSRLRV